jgi:hypothetical protein
MSNAVTHPREVGPAPKPDSPKPEEIRRQLQRILASPVFHGSKRCQQFLEYVCEQSLTGGVGALKERTIATEVFGRRPQSDLGEDTIVRVGAREVRKRLAQYYVTPEGAASEIRIDLPIGSYAPDFHYISGRTETVAPAAAPAVEPQRRWRIAVIWAGGIVLLVALVVFSAVKWTGAAGNTDGFSRFWEPVFRSPEPLLLAVAHPIVYHPSARASKMSEEALPAQDVPTQRPIQVPPEQLDGSDFVPVFNQYVGFGDMVAATEVSAMLARKSKSTGVRVRLASGIEFADLRRVQTLLIGSITNRWTMQFQQAWRFQFARIPGVETVIVDTTDKRRQWSVAAKPDGSAQEDYVLLCRIRNSLTGGLLLAAAGVKQFGTEAAGRLLTDPDQLSAILRNLPSGWETKNLQIVLHTKVIGNTAAQPAVVAWHVW